VHKKSYTAALGPKRMCTSALEREKHDNGMNNSNRSSTQRESRFPSVSESLRKRYRYLI